MQRLVLFRGGSLEPAGFVCFALLVAAFIVFAVMRVKIAKEQNENEYKNKIEAAEKNITDAKKETKNLLKNLLIGLVATAIIFVFYLMIGKINMLGGTILFMICALCVTSIIVYFLPALIAAKRKHKYANLIAILDLLTAWTFLGWVGLFVWALVDKKEASTVANSAEEIKLLFELKEKGAISEEEFLKKKNEILKTEI